MQELLRHGLVIEPEDQALIVAVSPPLYIDPTSHEAGPLALPDGIDAGRITPAWHRPHQPDG